MVVRERMPNARMFLTGASLTLLLGLAFSRSCNYYNPSTEIKGEINLEIERNLRNDHISESYAQGQRTLYEVRR